MVFNPKFYRNSKDGIGSPGDTRATSSSDDNTLVALAKGIYHLLSGTLTVTLSGGATEAKQDTQITHLAAIETAVEALDNAVSGSEIQVDVVGALPAGTNNIGDVDVLSLPALPAGTNNIGDVDVLSLPALPAGTNNIGDVDVLSVPADPFGANADAAATAGSTGSMQAKLRLMTSQLDAIKTAVETLDNAIGGSEMQVDIVGALPAGTNNIGDVDVLSLPALPAGTNNIGDVDVLSLPALAAGTNVIGKVSSADDTSAIYEGTTALTPKFAVIDAATSGDNTLIAAVASKKIRVLSCFLVAASAVNVRFESGASGTALTGQMNLPGNGGFVLPYNPAGWFQTATNTLLNLELSGAISVDGSITYIEVT